MRPFLRIAKSLGDETRVRALMAVKDRELCLCQIIDLLGLAPSTVSKHMTVLMDAGLVERRKEGRWHFYQWAGKDASADVRVALAWVQKAVEGEPVINKDKIRLSDTFNRSLEELSACYRV